jgi:membrane protease subunit HflC
MKKTINIVIFGLLLLIFGSFMFTFQVRQDEVAFLSTGGGEPKIYDRAGLKLRLPWPFQQLYKFDQRIHLETTEYEEMNSRNLTTVVMQLYFGWKIEDPDAFFNTFKGADSEERIAEARKQLKILVQESGKQVVKDNVTGVGYFIPTSDGTGETGARLTFDQTEKEILAESRKLIEKQGVSIEFVGIRRVGVPQKTLDDVLKSMVNEWHSEANSIKTDAESVASGITNKAVTDRDKAITVAKKQAGDDIDDAEKTAERNIKTFKKDPELATFLMQLKALEESVKTQTTLILDETMGPFPILRGVKPFLRFDSNGTVQPE